MRKYLQTITLILTAGATVGCAFVQVSDAGATVAQATSTDVVNCEEKGEIVTNTRSKVLIERGSTKVQQELIDLARNQAATMGANAIVPSGEPVDGSQKFRAYLCN